MLPREWFCDLKPITRGSSGGWCGVVVGWCCCCYIHKFVPHIHDDDDDDVTRRLTTDSRLDSSSLVGQWTGWRVVGVSLPLPCEHPRHQMSFFGQKMIAEDGRLTPLPSPLPLLLAIQRFIILVLFILFLHWHIF